MSSDPFDSWLGTRLKELEADDVFIPYIRSILEGDESHDDKATSLIDVIEGMGLENVQAFSDQIWSKWNSCQSCGSSSRSDAACDGASGGTESESKKRTVDLSAALESITDSRTKEYAASRALTASKSGVADKDVKAAIMAQYSQVVEEESDEEDEGDADQLEERNQNAETVAKADKEQKEKCRAQAAAKKEKDKEDREKQKKQAEERKKKAQEKSTKGERKR